MTLIEVMLSVTVLTIALGALLGSQIHAMKTQRNASYAVTLYALANSINDQVCGLGYDEVNNAKTRGATEVIAINNPATGTQIPVRITLDQACALTGATALKTDYAVHDGGVSGMDRLFTDAKITGKTPVSGGTYSTVRDLNVLVTATPVPGVSAYTVNTSVSFADGFGKTSRVSVARLVSNLTGYANVY